MQGSRPRLCPGAAVRPGVRVVTAPNAAAFHRRNRNCSGY
jgi:hypothetical protein